MNTDPACHRRYRRLLWAYPRWYRRERGTEILTTLLDAAGPDRRWPAAKDTADLLRGGLRRRVGVPRPGYLLIFVPISIFVGLLVSAWAIGLAVDKLAPRPSVQTAAAVAGTATGEPPHEVAGPVLSCGESGCPFGWGPDGDNVVAEDRLVYQDNGQDGVEVGYWPPEDGLAGWLAQARARLTAAGWTIVPADFVAFDGEFVAHKADLTVRVWTVPGARPAPSPDDDYLVTAPAMLMVQHTPPAGLNLFSWTGFLAGLVIGWWLTAWAVRRGRGHHGPRQTTILLTTIWAVLLTVGVDFEAFGQAVDDAMGARPVALTPTVLASWLIIVVVPTVLLLLLLLVLVLPVAAFPRTPGREAERAPTTARDLEPGPTD